MHLVEVEGDSMIEAGIHSGDIVVVDRSVEPKAVGEVRRSLLRAQSHVFKALVLTLATADHCSAEVRRELARAPAFQKRLQAVHLMPKPGDRRWTRRWWADEAKEVVSAFGLDTTPPPEAPAAPVASSAPPAQPVGACSAP